MARNPSAEPSSSSIRFSAFSKDQEESPGRQNEDAYVVLENESLSVAAVVDGATEISSITGAKGQKNHGVRFAAQTAVAAIKEGFTHDLSASDLLLEANQEIAKGLKKYGLDPETSPLKRPSANATLLRIDKRNKRLDIAQVGDTIGIIVKRGGKAELALPQDPEIYDAQAIALAIKIAQKQKSSLKKAISDPRVAQLMEKSRAADNLPDGKGSGVLNGSPLLKRYIRGKEWSLGQIMRVILLTDGLLPPAADFRAEPNWPDIAKIVDRKGLEGLYQLVRDLKNSDPDFAKFPRFKKHDDATGIVIDLT